MLTIKTNVAEVVARLQIKLSALADKDKMLRTCAVGILPVIKTRIHEEGKDASDSQIGTYSPGYMKVRTGRFQSPNTVRGKNKGKPRTNYNRTSDTKVVASLTRQMEDDFSVIPTDDGYGLGYNNPENRKKADHVETTYSKEIFSLTTDEKNLVVQIAKDYIAENQL